MDLLPAILHHLKNFNLVFQALVGVAFCRQKVYHLNYSRSFICGSLHPDYDWFIESGYKPLVQEVSHPPHILHRCCCIPRPPFFCRMS